jgi:hypothetical protein
MAAPPLKPLLSNKYISVDGILLWDWPSHASLERIDKDDYH